MVNNFDYAKLAETKLWKCYEGKLVEDDRRKWIKDVYFNAVKQLTTVRDTFSNYTLHDETHIINVMEAIAGLLGNQIENLTAGETELLILATCLHDIGMVYTPEDKKKWLKRQTKCNEYIRENNSELMGLMPEDWNDNTKQNYFRWLHPFRVSEVLDHPEWGQIFSSRPKEIVSKQTIIAVCQAHGEKLADIELTISKARDVDVLFCAMLLRIGDLLDFDDSRAPQILYSYAEKNMKSQEEWDKHNASIGFNYPDSPSTNPLPYAAECVTPGVEHSVRNFLKWVDDELSNCRKVQNRFHKRWRSFPIPYEIDKNEIESIGYETGDFKLTMDQDQIINLLVGENLYESNDIFVRELLQNSIDATLLRSKLESDFHAESEDARIDLWEWYDTNGNIWFRIDDRGIGMTKGMLQRYFLKIGNSYYNSDELKRDMRDHRQENYNAISRFGIGFLSCFLCGKSAEISTLYFDPEKSKRENENKAAMYGYGIRMNITGLTDYYIMNNQASNHTPIQTFPIPKYDKASVCEELEMDGYRHKPGTSIAVCIEPGKLGGINLRKTVERYLCCPRMPVYYNGKRLGETYREFMEKATNADGEYLYELTDEDKEKLNTDGAYLYRLTDEDKEELSDVIQEHRLQIKVTIKPIDLLKNHILEGLSGVIVKYDLINGSKFLDNFSLSTKIKTQNGYIFINSKTKKRYKDILLKIKLDNIVYHFARFIASKTLGSEIFEENAIVCAYHGIFGGAVGEIDCNELGKCMAIIFLEDIQRPKVDIGRTRISELNLSSTFAICALINQLSAKVVMVFDTQFEPSLAEWRKLRELPLGNWLSGIFNCTIMNPIEASLFLDTMNYSIEKGMLQSELGFRIAEVNGQTVINNFILAYFQDTYEITIDYIKGQIITLSYKNKDEQEVCYDLFPPMMFCKAKDDNSRQYICCKSAKERKGITADHPYTIWLLNNASVLNRHFNRQFKQIVNSLCNEDADVLMQTLNSVHEQLYPIMENYGINMGLCPKLSKSDFWHKEKINNT